MSIFKDTLKQTIQNQLKTRQEALVERTPTSIQYYNSRNAWIRMCSSVNVGADNSLASRYILQGGILDENNKQKSGIGTDNKVSYSTVTPGSTFNRLGIRPMPGITSIDVKSKAAYGSLREVTVNFVAWDIRQLEDLELLYMRPGYSVLVEWGWAPYLNNEKKLSSINTIGYYSKNIINPPQGFTKEKIFEDLYKEAVETYQGNYDAMFGYVKNYSWSARADGGYDCTTTIISLGEVLESLKVNYAPFNDLNTISTKGLISSKLKTPIISISELPNIKKEYSKNVLAGLFYELFTIGQKSLEEEIIIEDDKSKYALFGHKQNLTGGQGESSGTGNIGASDNQIYITLESLCNIINNYVTFKDSKGNDAYIKCSTLDRKYLNPTTPNPLTGDGHLLCLAHPLQLSVDPSVCVIKNPVWINGFKINPEFVLASLGAEDGNNIIKFNSKLNDVQLDSVLDQLYYISIPTKKIKNKQAVVDYLKKVTEGDADTIKALTARHYQKLRDPNYKVARPQYTDLISVAIDEGDNIDNTKLGKSLRLSGVGSQFSLFTFLNTARFTNLSSSQINEAFGSNVEFTKSDPVAVQQAELDKAKKELENNQSTSISGLQYLNNIKKRPYFYKDDWKTELGIIGNIYVNLNFLYRLASDSNLESADTKEKKDINLYDFLKSVLSEISSATGNVNNFDLFVENDKVYIIDVNYVDSEERKKVYDDIFKLEIHNLKSTVRSYKLESQIFPDQSTTIAIGAQVGGGALATDANTMLDFNKGLTDRIIPKKEDPTIDPNRPDADKILNQLKNINSALNSLYDFFGNLEYGIFKDGNYDVNKSSEYKNSLKDLINFFKNLTKSNIKNRAIIPTKLSITMDGIGGLVIGQLFKINEDLLPRGYKGGELGSRLGYAITGIGHSINGNDWITNIDSQFIILDDPSPNLKSFADVIKINPETGAAETSTPNINKAKKSLTGGTSKIICGVVRKNGDVEDLLVSINPNLYSRHYSPVNESDKGRIRLQPNAIRDLEAMLIAAFKEDQLIIKVNSAYRTYADQVRIKSEAKGIPAATPGTSNHGFGLAVDLADKNGTRINITGLSGNKTIPKTPKEWEWLQKNAEKYGFKVMNNNNESHHYDYIRPGINC